MAYVSDESGVYDVYVRPFPDLEGMKHRISTEGGWGPRWSRDGRELFYRRGNPRKIMAVKVDTRGPFRAGPPRALFDDTFGDYYDVAPDGRFLFVEEPKGVPAPTRMVLIPDWASALEAKLRARQP